MRKGFGHVVRPLVVLGWLAWLSAPPLFAQSAPDSAQIVLTVPHLAFPAEVDTMVVPVELRNAWDPVGGLQVDLTCGRGDLLPDSLPGFFLDTVLTTARTAQWRADLLDRPRHWRGTYRVLLFDPAGSNIAPGEGPVMQLVFLIAEGSGVPDVVPLSITALSVSDPVGMALFSRSSDGSLTLGAAVEVTVGAARADEGESVVLPILLSSAGAVAGVQFTLTWKPDLLEFIEVSTTGRAERFQLEWEPAPAGQADSLPKGVRIWLYARSDREIPAGEGPVLEAAFQVEGGIFPVDIIVGLSEVRVMDIRGRERAVTRITPGRITVFPGRLDSPGHLAALSGQDGQVSLYWASPTGGEGGLEPILLVDDDASQLGPPYLDVAGRMADDLTIAGYAFDYYLVPVGGDGPGGETLGPVSTLIWMTGYEWGFHPTLTPNDQAVLAAFLERGGVVWLIGQDIIWDIGEDFVQRYFGARVVAEDGGTPEMLIGSAGGILADGEYPAAVPPGGMDYGDVLTTSHTDAHGLVDGLTHFGAVVQERTAFWALEYTYLFGQMDRVEGIRRQLAAFGIEPVARPGIGRVLIRPHAAAYAPRGPSPVKAEAAASGFTPNVDSLRLIPAPERPAGGQPLPVTGYAVYRHHEQPVPLIPDTRLATVGPDVFAWVDTAVIHRQSYAYAVTAIYDDRYESPPSREAMAVPLDWVDFAVSRTRVTAGDEVVLPVRMENADPVAGIRFELRDDPPGLLSRPRAVLGSRVPPDWVVSLDRDTLAGAWLVAAFSPRLSTISPGRGAVFHLTMEARAAMPVTVGLEADEVIISDAHGDAYNTGVADGSVSIGVQLARLRVGTGAPTQPGDTGYVSIFMENPRPVLAFQMVLRSGLEALQVVDVQGTARLPADAHVAHSTTGRRGVRLIGSSFSNTPIPAGQGPVATIAYRVSPDAPEGLVDLDLEEVLLTDDSGHTLQQTTVSGSFPVGRVRAVFAPDGGEGQPGRTITVPVGLTNSVDLCGFALVAGYDPRYLTFLTSEPLDRLPYPRGLAVVRGTSGMATLRYVPETAGPIPAGQGPLLNLVFQVAHKATGDTTLTIALTHVSASGCADVPVFAVGQEGEIVIGKSPPEPGHFQLDVAPTGITHFIQVQSATLGGVYLDAGDEVAVMDSTGWASPEGEAGVVLAGAGVVQEDGSVNITAVVGFSRRDPFGDPGSGGSLLPGARPGGIIHFQAWDRDTDREGRPTTDARYVLGQGRWGENNGLTIVELVRVPQEAVASPQIFPEKLEVEANNPNPFSRTTTIRFGLPGEMEVKVTIHDLLGQEVVTLHDGITAGGFHEVVWDGSNAAGTKVKNGMYFYRVRTPAGSVTRKLLYMR